MRRAPGQGERCVEQQHRQEEVAHHQIRVEVVAHHEAAEHRLPHHAQRKEHAEDRQVAAIGAAHEREAGGRDHDDAHEPGDHPVAELDHRVELQRRDRAAVALGPVRAAEARAGEAHGRARQHDHRQRAHGHDRHPLVELGRDRDAGAQRRATARELFGACHAGEKDGS